MLRKARAGAGDERADGGARREGARHEDASCGDASSGDARRRGGRMASASLLVAVGTGIGNVLAYAFNLVLSRGLGPGGYAELGTLLSVFLIGTVPGLAVQAINARRLAVVAEAPSAQRAALVRGLRRRGLAVGGGVAAVFVALAPAIAALLPSVTVGGVAWTGVSLAANTVFASYLGIAQGTSRFVTMTLLYLAAQGSRLAIGAVAAASQVSPTTVMAAQTAAWAFAAVAGRWMLREEAAAPSAAEPATAAAVSGAGRGSADRTAPHHGYLTEVLRATGGLGGILLLTVLDTLLASRYLTDGDLGRYNTGALLARAAFFAPSFVAMLAYPRLARPMERRRALLTALALTGGIGVLGVAIAGIGGDPLIGVAFGQKYATPGGFDLGADGWLFTSVGALLALVNLALLDGVARRSHVVSAVVLGGIVLETTVIVGFAHGSAGAIVTAAAACSLVTATASVTTCLMARTAGETVTARVDIEDTQAVGAVTP
jgi:O-antigen/teichoic acid export membrane protein